MWCLRAGLSIQGHQGGGEIVNIYLVGVGGQGIVTASRIIGDASILAGKNVLLSETHGMAQRGGTVMCTARIGDVYSPLIPDGQADIILSFELLETLRALCHASKKTIVVSSTEKIMPLSASAQKLHYPALEEVKAHASRLASDLATVDAPSLAREAGVPMSSNLVMIGALAGTGRTGLDRKYFEDSIEANISRRRKENLRAFAMGHEALARPRRT